LGINIRRRSRICHPAAIPRGISQLRKLPVSNRHSHRTGHLPGAIALTAKKDILAIFVIGLNARITQVNVNVGTPRFQVVLIFGDRAFCALELRPLPACRALPPHIVDRVPTIEISAVRARFRIRNSGSLGLLALVVREERPIDHAEIVAVGREPTGVCLGVDVEASPPLVELRTNLVGHLAPGLIVPVADDVRLSRDCGRQDGREDGSEDHHASHRDTNLFW